MKDYKDEFPRNSLIQDKSLGNYFIVDDGICFTVYVVEKYDPNEKRGRVFRTKKSQNKNPKALTYHPNAAKALEYVARQLLHDDKKNYTLKEYANTYRDIKNEILNIEL